MVATESGVQLVLSTCPADHAQSLADELVLRGLAACVNILPGLRSVYQWQGELCRETESLLLIKTSSAVYPQLETVLSKLHPFDVPEIVAVPVGSGLAGYLDWVRQSVQVASNC